MTNSPSGSVLLPFDQVRVSVFNMAMKMYEASVIEKVMKVPTEQNMKVLADFVFSDPNWPPKDDLPN